MTSGIIVSGVGHHLPTHFEDNESIAARLGLDPNWIVEKTGIHRRGLSLPHESASDYATQAAQKSLQSAGLEGKDLGLIVSCTYSSDYYFPPLASKLHLTLGAGRAQTLTVQANCAGFPTGLTLASDRMRADSSLNHALVVGVELNSRYVDRDLADGAILFGDGAGAAVLSRGDSAYGIMASAFHTDSSNYEAARLRGGGSSFRFTGRSFDPELDYMEVNSVASGKQAITHLPGVLREACEKSGITVKDLDWVIFHQVNLHLITYLTKKLGLDPAKNTFTNVAELGNTGAASIGIALSQAAQQGCFRDGDLVALAGAGAGFNFAANVWRWRAP